MKNLILYLTFIFLFFSIGFSQNSYWVSTQLPDPLSNNYHQALGETCILFAEHTSQAVHAFDINLGEWKTLLVPTQLDWINAKADGNVAMIFNDSIVAAYSALTSSFSALNFNGNQISTTMNPYGCIDNFAWILTDQYLYVFDAEDGDWHSFSYTPPGEMPWGGGIYGKGDYIYMSLWVTSNSALHTLVAYSMHTKTFVEFTESNVESFELLDHGFTFNSNIHADPYFCGGYSAYTGEFKTKTHDDRIYDNGPLVYREMVSPLICELFTTRELISGNDYIDYMWVYNTEIGDFAEYSYSTTWNHYYTTDLGCGGQTAFVMINNVDNGNSIECVAYSALTNSFSHFSTPLYNWGLMSFTAGGLMIDGYDEQNYFLYDVETGQTFTHSVQWTESVQPGVKARALANYWSVFAYTEQYEDTTHVFSYTREDGSLYYFIIDGRASTSGYKGMDFYGLLETDGGTVTSTFLYSPTYNNWIEKNHASSNYFGSAGNYYYINYTNINQTYFYDGLTNQEYSFPSAQSNYHVLERDSVFQIYSAEGYYIGYSVIQNEKKEYTQERYSGMQWNNQIVLNINGSYGNQNEYLLYDGQNNLFAPLILTEEDGLGRASWPGGKTALVVTEYGFLYAYYPGDITNIEDRNESNLSADAGDLQLFPNPARGVLYLQSAVGGLQSADVVIYDLHGRILNEKHITAGNKKIEIDVSDLQTGIYFVQLHSGNKTTTKKLIIQK